MTDLEKLQAAIAKLDQGGWSLSVTGFAARALKIKTPLTFKQKSELRDLMHQTGLEHRRVMYGGEMIDVWDYQA